MHQERHFAFFTPLPIAGRQMNRLQKKCFIASAGFHLLLGLILLIGPAFLSSNSKTEDVPMVEFVAINTTDANIQGGGSPKGGSPPPAALPTPPTPAPVVDKTPAPEPPKIKKEKPQEVTPPKDETPSLE